MTNARSVSISAARKLGYLLIGTFLLLVMFRPAKGAQITITVTGTLNGGRDQLGIFGGGVMPAGTPYTLVYTFDDSKGQPMKPGCTGSGITGGNEASPGTAVLTIREKSYTFGTGKQPFSKAWRTTQSPCSGSEIAMDIAQGQFPSFSSVSIRVAPQGSKSLTQDTDWRAPVSVTGVYARNTYNLFSIMKPGNNVASTMSYLSVTSITISSSKGKSWF